MTIGRITNLTTESDPWEALDALRSRYATDRTMPPGSFTALQYLERYPHLRTSKCAKAELTRMVEASVLVTKKIPLRGSLTNVYWIPEVPPCPEPTLTSGPTGKRRGRTGG